jgi:hypothetical protein
MLHIIKQKLRTWLFSDEELEIEAKRAALRHMQENANIVSLARAQLSGIDVSSITEWAVRNHVDLDILDGKSTEDRRELLNNAHEVYTNTALQSIVDHLIKAQIVYGIMETDSLQGLNFNRATINGLHLLMDELRRLEGLYREEHARPEEYDPYEVV